jgi:hypothetical protein
MMDELGLSYKRPKFYAKSDDPNYARKKKEVKNYQRIAPLPLGKKRGVLVTFQDKTWDSLYPKIEAEWMEKGKQKPHPELPVKISEGIHSSRFCGLLQHLSKEKRQGVQDIISTTCCSMRRG